MSAIYFSEHFKITQGPDDDWFDPILGADTKLFADPFLVFKDRAPEWVGTHEELIAYFNIVYHMVGNTMLSRRSPERQKALNLLLFPEPRWFCLGYTDEGTRGSGGGLSYAKLICNGMELSIGRGLTDLSHFEALGVLNEGIGPDRISDLLCNVIIGRLVSYTISVAARHKLSVKRHRIERGEFDAANLRWNPIEAKLPTNPRNGLPILLIPRRFLRALPTLDASDFWQSTEAAQLRADLNYSIATKVNKKAIVDLARRDPDAVDKWTRSREAAEPVPYDFDNDPVGVYNWLRTTRSYAATTPLALAVPASHADFVGIVDQLIQDFKHFVEQREGWKLLHNDDGTEKAEEAAQLVFRGVAEARCQANNIVIDREVNVGRGPVDFKFSSGFSNRALIEIKKLHNGKFWNGLELQLTTYLAADHCDVGRFVAIQYKAHERNTEVGRRALTLPKRTTALAKETGLDLRSSLVDARRPRSASKL